MAERSGQCVRLSLTRLTAAASAAMSCHRFCRPPDWRTRCRRYVVGTVAARGSPVKLSGTGSGGAVVGIVAQRLVAHATIPTRRCDTTQCTRSRTAADADDRRRRFSCRSSRRRSREIRHGRTARRLDRIKSRIGGRTPSNIITTVNMEEQLISEIEQRPVLYDRSVQACKKMSARDDAWREVADIMKQTEPEVKKRWRTLRDSFMRFHRLQRTCGPKGKKKTWMYYHEMAFLIPHIEPREYKMAGFDGNEYDQETMDNGRQESHAADMVSIASDMCETELTTPPIGSVVQCHCFADGHSGGGGEGPQLGAQEPVEHGVKRKRLADDPDSDEHFALSCVAALRKLTARKNAEIRMRILHILYEAEYGEEPVLK